MATFLSYSRRQLYFAEALALHLQKAGLDVWFDLQQLQAGKVWSDGLESGVGSAERLVLVASRASLESAYTQVEWQGVAARGREVVLALYEPVELPEELRGLPTYDFRRGFGGKLRQLVAYLKGDAEPRHDRVPAPTRWRIPLALPGAVWLTLAALFAPLIGCLAGLGLTWLFAPAGSGLAPGWFFWAVSGLSLLLGAAYAIRLLRHRLAYKKVKRGALLGILLLVPAIFAVDSLVEGGSLVPAYSVAGLLLPALFFYLVVLRRSAGLLRWMQPEEDLQRVRRRAHQPLVDKAAFDVDAAAERGGRAVSYAIHADRADAPLARWVERVFAGAGHRRVPADDDPEHHVAILSNRSSAAWAREVTRAHAGKLVFVVASTIELDESLADTSRYQWVDARDGDRRDIGTLARSLGDPEAWKREAALEATPAMIDRWKVPGGINLLKRVMEIFAIFLLVFGATDLVGFVMGWLGVEGAGGEGSAPRSVLFVAVGAACFWLAGRALVYRKVPAPWLYGFLVVSVTLVARWGKALPDFLKERWWLPAAVILPLLAWSALTSGFWLPSFAPSNSDEVGIKRSIDRRFKRRRWILVAAWVAGILGYVGYMLVTMGK